MWRLLIWHRNRAKNRVECVQVGPYASLADCIGGAECLWVFGTDLLRWMTEEIPSSELAEMS
jgi:hypothetical protein